MIALDANTALRSFRDGRYDIKAILEVLQALADGTASVKMAKYADGRIAYVATPAMVEMTTGPFPSLTIGSGPAVSLRPVGGHLAIARGQQGASLSAQIDGSLLKHTGGGPVPIKGSHIKKLRAATLYLSNGKPLEGKAAGHITAASVSANSLSTQSATVGLLTGSARLATFDSVLYSRKTRTAETPFTPNTILGRYVGPRTPIFHRVLEVTGSYLGIQMPAVMDGARRRVRFQVPSVVDGEATSAGTEGDVGYQSSGTSTQAGEAALIGPKADVRDLTLWPCWAVSGRSFQESQGSGSYTSSYMVYETTVEACLDGVPDQYPYAVVAVRNSTSSKVKVANVWQFGGRDNPGAINVLNRIELPPYSHIDFMFSFNYETSTGCMHPTRRL